MMSLLLLLVFIFSFVSRFPVVIVVEVVLVLVLDHLIYIIYRFHASRLPYQESPPVCVYHPVAGTGLENQQLFDSKLFLV